MCLGYTLGSLHSLEKMQYTYDFKVGMSFA